MRQASSFPTQLRPPPREPVNGWGDTLAAVARRLLGEPRRRHRGGAEWRYGAKGSLAVHVEGPRAGTWRDHEAGVGGGVIALVQHIEGCDRDAALEWLRDHDHLGRRGQPPHPAAAPCPRPPTAPSRAADTLALARRLWADSRSIPADPRHPARLWLAGTGDHGPLWRPDVPAPASIRWAEMQGGGALVGCLAPWSSWREAWPGMPTPQAVQVVYVRSDGRPAKVGGLGKRTHGPMAGGVVLVGTPNAARILLCEGLADALALASRRPWTVAATCGTSPYRDPAFADALARLEADVEIWTDSDGPGAAAAWHLAELLQVREVSVTRYRLNGAKDPGAAGAAFPDLDRADLNQEAAREVAASQPYGEAYRLAAAWLGEAHYDEGEE